MTWQTVQSSIIFWSSTTQWVVDPNNSRTLPSEFSSADQAAILGYLEELYNGSAIARSILESGVVNGGKIRIGQSASESGLSVTGVDNYILLNLSKINDLYYFNSTGELVQEKPQITIIHELIHNINELSDPSPSNPTESQMNAAGFDFDGDTVRVQNQVSQEMGYSDNIQRNYFSSMLDNDSRFSEFTVNYSYSSGQPIDIARFGDASANTLDHSARTDNSRDLLFGLGGNDTLKGGGGNDFLYGGSGNDSLNGGADNDSLLGEGGDDTLDGSDGNDTLHGGFGHDSMAGGAGNDSLNAGDGDNTLVGGAGGDILIGGTGADVYMFSASGDGADVIFDSDGSGQIIIGGATLSGNATFAQGSQWTLNGYTLTLLGTTPGEQSMTITKAGVAGQQVGVLDFTDGDFGIRLKDPDDPSDNSGAPGPRPVNPGIDAADSSFGQARGTISPLVIDLDGDGFHFTNVANSSNAFFDLKGNGFAVNASWNETGDGTWQKMIAMGAINRLHYNA